jgi:16S rRNA (guanine966-N2)-methyltransferase
MDGMGQTLIVAGKWKRRKIKFPSITELRPTLARIKETMFNWLRNDIANANCLDLFAGSGSLGLEALSRGAKHVCFVEGNQLLIRNLQDNLTKLKANDDEYTLCCQKFPAVLAKIADKFDIVFLDPPYEKISIAEVLAELISQNTLNPKAIIIFENRKVDLADIDKSFLVIKSKATGKFQYGMLRLN